MTNAVTNTETPVKMGKMKYAIKLWADGFQTKEQFDAEFLKSFPDFPKSPAGSGYLKYAFEQNNPGATYERPKKASAPKAPKEPRVAKPAPEKVGPTKSTKTPEEIAAIKAANLQRMKDVSAKLKAEKEKAAA